MARRRKPSIDAIHDGLHADVAELMQVLHTQFPKLQSRLMIVHHCSMGSAKPLLFTSALSTCKEEFSEADAIKLLRMALDDLSSSA